MRKILLSFLILSVAGFGFAQTDIFFPPNPGAFGQGGAYTANAEGLNAFFYNPAGFARDGEFTLLSVNPYAFASGSLIDFAIGLANGSIKLPGSDQSVISRQSGDEDSDPFAGLDLEALGISEALMDEFIKVGNFVGEDEDFDMAEDMPTILEDEAVQKAFKDAGISQDTIDQLIEDGANAEDPEAYLQEVLVVVAPVLTNPEALTAVLDATVDVAVANGASGDPETAYDRQVVEKEGKKMADKFPSGNLRAGAMVSIGYVGNGLGFGLFIGADAIFNGANILTTKGRVFNTVTFAAGFAVPIGPLTLGAQVRPTFVGYSTVNPSEFFSAMMVGDGTMPDPSALVGDVYTGFRIGFDVGALFDLGPFTFGAAIKDLIPFQLQSVSAFTPESYGEALASGELPLGPDAGGRELTKSEMESLYQVPPLKVNVGASFHPDLGGFSNIIDPRVSVDIHDVFGFVRNIGDNADEVIQEKTTILNYLNLGAEVKFLRFASVRAGYAGGVDGGALSAGLGLHLLFLDLNAAVAATNFQSTPDGVSFKNLGASVELAIRF